MEMGKMPERLIDVNYVDASLEFYAAAHSPVEGKKEKIIYDTLQACRKILGNAPTVDAVRAVHGKWDADPCGWHCSECGADGRASWHYCPNCGAKMDGGTP
jgi:hypothetical protein